MTNLAMNVAERDFYPFDGADPQSVYDCFASNALNQLKPHDDGICFSAQDNEPQYPYRVFNRSFEENPHYPYFRAMEDSNFLLTAWRSKCGKEPTEFEALNLKDMSHDNIAWLRASGESSSMIVDKMDKLLAMVYHEEGWRVDIRRSGNFQLREVVHHATPVIGVFFHNDVVFSLSNELIASYPEERHENCLIYSSRKVLGWAQHPTDPYLILIEPEHYRIIDLNTLGIVKTAEWTESMKWFNLLQKYSNHSLELYADKSTTKFSTDGNRLFLGGYGQLAIFDWYDLFRPRCVQPKPSSMISTCLNSYSTKGQKKKSDAHIIDMVSINRDKLLCATADGYLSMLNTRTGEVFLLLKPGSGVRINSLQLCANGKYLAMLGYYYGFDASGNCEVETALLIWKLSRLLNRKQGINTNLPYVAG